MKDSLEKARGGVSSLLLAALSATPLLLLAGDVTRLVLGVGIGGMVLPALFGVLDGRGRLAGVRRAIAVIAGMLLGGAWAGLAGRLLLIAPDASWWSLPWVMLLFAGSTLPVLLAMAFPARLSWPQGAFLGAQMGVWTMVVGMPQWHDDGPVSGLVLLMAGAHLLAWAVAWAMAERDRELQRLQREREALAEDLAGTRDALQEMREARESVSRELAVTRNQAEIADVAKTEFLATISHEIRTPLNGILPILEMLRETSLESEQRQHVDTALSSSRHLLRIINDILDFSKIEAGKLELESINLNLRDVVQAVTALLSKSAERKGLKITTIIHDDVPLFVSGDPIRLRQILINLVGNAIKFTNQGGVSVEVINQRSGRRIVDLLFVVRDTGIGMSAKTAGKLFRSFSQADASTTRKHGGSGLGLAICKRLVELMGGTIGVRSQQGVGSLFWFQVPFRRTLEVNEHRTDLSNARVLVVSEDSAWRRRLDSLLGRWGVMKAIAQNTEEAANKLTSSARLGFSWTYEAVIIDAGGLREDIPIFIAELRRLTEMDDLKILVLGDRSRLHLPDDAEGYVEILGEKCSDNDIRQALNHLLGVGQATPEQTWWHDDAPELLAIANDLEVSGEVAPVGGPPAAEVGDEGPRDFEGHVLVAEDNPVNLAVIVRLLGKLGLSVDQALNGAEAVKMIGERSYDLVFMDCQMPGVDGYEATRIVREREHESVVEHPVPIIAMTANAMPGDRERCLQCGMDDYLSKPVDRTSLRQLLAHWLDDRAESDTGPVSSEPALPACPMEDTVETAPVDDVIPPESPSMPEPEPEPVQAPSVAELPTDGTHQVLDNEVLDELREIMEDEFSKLLQRYLDTAPAQLDSIDRTLLLARLDEVAKVAHSLKSSCANVGAMVMSNLAKQLELAAKANNQILCLELNQQLMREARLVETALTRLLASEDLAS